MAQSAKNKYDFVNGALPKLKSTSINYATWIPCNHLVSSWLLNSISKDLADSVLHFDTAAGIWKDLTEPFYQGNGPRIFQIQKFVASLSQAQTTVTAHYTRLKGLWEE